MRRKSPRWMCCVSESGEIYVSPRLKSIFAHAIKILEEDDDEHLCAAYLFEVIIDLIGIGEWADLMHEEVGRA